MDPAGFQVQRSKSLVDFNFGMPKCRDCVLPYKDLAYGILFLYVLSFCPERQFVG